MSWQDGLPDIDEFSDGIDFETLPRRRANSDVSQLDLENKTKTHGRKSSMSSTGTASTVHASGILSPNRGGSLSPGSYEESYVPPTPSVFQEENSVRPRSVHRGVVALATEDTTLAVIPAEAFRRLTKNFPKATGHIVQGSPVIFSHR